MICLELDVRMRPIGADMHGVRADSIQACWKPQVNDLEGRDGDIVNREN